MEMNNENLSSVSDTTGLGSLELTTTPSTKLNLPRRNPSLETVDIPNEIWLRIFELATNIPGAFDTFDADKISAFTLEPSGDVFQKRADAVMKLKLAINLVSKSWNAMTISLLYEHIVIHGAWQPILLLRTIRRHQRMSGRNLTSATIRVDILAGTRLDVWNGEHSMAIISILNCCSNLVCLSTAFATLPITECNYPGFIEAAGLRATLKRLEVRADISFLRSICELLSQSLEVLWLSATRRSTPSTDDKLMHFPTLHTLVAGPETEWSTNLLHLPNLRACAIKHDAGPFNLPGLDKAKIRQLYSVNTKSIAPEIELWTNLDTLVVAYDELMSSEIAWPKVQQQCIKRLILVPEWLTCSTSAEILRKNLENLLAADNFASLERIQLLAPRKDKTQPDPPIFSTTTPEVWLTWLIACENRNIFLEVSEGVEEWTSNAWKQLPTDKISRMLQDADEFDFYRT